MKNHSGLFFYILLVVFYYIGLCVCILLTTHSIDIHDIYRYNTNGFDMSITDVATIVL